MAESEKVQGIIDTIKELNVLELSQLVKALETEFGVTAAAPMAMAPIRRTFATAQAKSRRSNAAAAVTMRC